MKRILQFLIKTLAFARIAIRSFAIRLVALVLLLNSHFTFAQTGSQTFTSSGTFTVPEGVTSITVQAWGGGGGGSTITASSRRGGGGGGGAYASSILSGLTSGNTYSVIIGAGGAANSGGGNTSFGVSTVVADGGNGGASNSSNRGTGGTAGSSTGTTKYDGGDGANGGSVYSGGGGGGAGTTGSGGDAPTASAGSRGSGTFQNGGNGGVSVSGGSNGQAGNNYGAGGSGACTNSSTNRTGGSGAPGLLIVTWTCPSATISYSSPSFCKNEGPQTVTLTGSAGGTFSAPAGLSLNSSTGEITPSSSTAGPYLVTYSITGTGGCSNVNATASVRIYNVPGTPTSPVNGSNCGTGTVDLSATAGMGQTLDWYSSSSGGVALATGTLTFTTPTISSTTTYYAENRSLVSGCLSDSRSSLIATIYDLPAITVQPSTPAATCTGSGSQTISVTATGSGLAYSWRKDGIALVNGGVVSGQGTATLTLTSPTTIDAGSYDVVVSGTCTPSETSTAVMVTVNQINTSSAGSSTPNLCINTALTDITHTTTGATGISNNGVSGANGLPSGISATWAANTITISGTPSVAGTFNYSIPLTGGCGTVNATGTIIVTDNMSASAGSSSPTLCINTALTNITHSTTLATGISNSGVSGANGLPAGVSATWAANTITISGTPSAAGTFNYSIPLTGGCGIINATGTITVNAVTSITVQPSAPAATCSGSGSQVISVTADGGSLSYSWRKDGIAVSNSGVISGQGTNTLTLTSPTLSNVGSYDVVISGACGAPVTSSAVAVSVNSLPAITVQPTAPAATCSGTGTQTMSVTATGSGLTYTWRKGGIAVVNGSIISGQGTNTLTLTDPLVGESGSWDVVVAGTCSPSVTSNSVTVTVNSSPTITVQPNTPVATCDGSGSQVINVTATGGGLTYSWRVGGVDLVNGGVISGQGTATLTLTSPTLSDAGSYDVVISGTCPPTITSSSVTVSVKTIPSISGTTPNERCQTGTVTLGATPSAGTVNWYAASTGGASLGSGTSFVTPSISANTNFYVDATLNGCTTTSRTAVLATVWDLPTVSAAGSDILQCNNSSFTLAGNVPIVGTGAWTVTFGSATVVSPSANNSSVTGIASGAAATLRWTISNGTCPVSQDNVTLRNFALATVSDAGPDQAQCNNGNFTLAGNSPVVGNGVWTVTSGTATIITNNSPTSAVTGVPVGTSAVLTWTITNGVCSSASSVTLSNDVAPTVSNAGSDISQCNSNAFSLSANTPIVGTGLWSVVSGAASITTPNSPSSAATLAVGLTSTIQWTISNGACPSSSSSIILTNSSPATVSNAGAAQFNCNNSSFTLAANVPIVGTGLWSVNSGTATISTPVSETSGVTGVPVGTAPILTWTITNGSCISTSNVTLTNYDLPTTSNAGAAIFNCNSTVFAMAGNTPTVGTGTWSVVSGSATIASPNSPTSSVTLTSGSTATLRWTISNGTCTPSTSDVVITNVILSTTLTGTNITCPRGSDGTVTLTVSGGLAPYSFLWNELVTTQNLIGVPAGNYQCVITDSRGCTKTVLQTLTQPADIDTNVVMVNSTCGACPDGSLTVTASGGTPGYTYLWSNGSTSTTRSGLLKGTYPITITDSRGCPATFNIIQLGPISADIIATSACLPNQGSATVVGVGGHPPYSFLWSTGSTATTITGLSSGNYNCTVTDNTGNSYNQTTKITNADYSTVSAAPPTTAICPGASVNISSTNAQNPVWSPSSGLSSTTVANPVATPASSTTYTLQVTQPTPSLVINGDFSSGNTGFYSDYGYVSPAANAAAGNAGLWPEGYYAVGTNAHTYHPNWSNVGGHGGSGNFMILNGAPVNGAEVWSQTIGVINQNTNYNFSTWIQSVHPSNVARLRFSINGVLQGAIISPSSTPGTWSQFTTTWNSGSSTTADIAIVNINTVLGGNDFGLDDITFSTTCTNPNVASVAITVRQPPSISTHPSNTIGCIGQNTSFSVVAAGDNLTYRWQISTNGGGSYSNLSNGATYSNVTTSTLNITGVIAGMNNYRYRVVVTGTCSPTATSTGAILTVNSAPTITSSTPGSNCGTGTVNLAATGSAGTLNWYDVNSGGSSLGTGTSFTTPTISSTTTYYVDATNNGCTTATRTSVVATIKTIPTITSSAGGSRCSTGSVTISATPSAGTVNWYAASSGGSSLGTGNSFATPSISTTTTYYAEAVASGCSSTSRESVVATINSPPAVIDPPPNTSVCMGNNTSFTLNASGVSPTYQWQLSTNNGGSFTDISNGGVYSNATTVTLNITAATLSMDSYQYRCVISSSGCTSTNSSAAILSVHNPGLGLSGYSPVSGDYFWTGLNTIDWNTLNNWLYYDGTTWSIPGSDLPAAVNNVYIRAGGLSNACISGANQPTLSSTGYSKNLFIETGATLTVSGSPTLNVDGNWTNEGSFLPATGIVQFTSNGNQTITTNGITVGKQFYDISIKTPNARRLIVPAGHEMKVTNNVTVQP